MRTYFLIVVLGYALFSGAQPGGTRAFRFLDIPATARAAALGGSNMSIWGDDVNLIHSNPSLLNPSMSKHAALNYNGFAGISHWYAAQAYDFSKSGTAALSLQAFNYGTFAGYDELGNKTPDFRAADYSINMVYASPVADSIFNAGIAIKTLISQYEGYSSYGNVIDFGITYHHKNELTASLLVRNLGFIWKTYSGGAAEPLPQTVQFGLSKKVEKAPFRIFFVYDQLLKWNLGYISPIDTTGRSGSFTTNETPKDSTGWQKFSAKAGSRLDNLMRHITFGTEIVLTKNFNLMIAYNYRRQSEMSLTERRGMNGFSFGFRLNVKRFGFSFSHGRVGFPASSNVVGISLKW